MLDTLRVYHLKCGQIIENESEVYASSISIEISFWNYCKKCCIIANRYILFHKDWKNRRQSGRENIHRNEAVGGPAASRSVCISHTRGDDTAGFGLRE